MSLSPSSSRFLDLPIELLVEICRQSDNPNLLLVCRDLRDIICSTPFFWESVHVGEPQFTEDAILFLKKRLERGARCPLYVSIQSTTMSTVLEQSMEGDLCRLLAAHKGRIRTLDICTTSMSLSGRILDAVLLADEPLAMLPSFRKLQVRQEWEDVRYYPGPKPFHIALGPIASLFPTLTTLVLPFGRLFIPYPASPIPSLRTLVLDGSIMPWASENPNLYQVAQLLAHTPSLETFWCKEQSIYFHDNLSNERTVAADRKANPDGSLPVDRPVLLPRLTRLAIAVTGIGTLLLHAISAPLLLDLHMDGTRDEEEFGDVVAWLHHFPSALHAALQTTATRSPALRRLALIGAYLPRYAWEWLLGCGPPLDLPFPLLDSVAVRGMEAVKWQVVNTVDDALIELYARQGRAALRRFVYTASEPPLSGGALHQLVNSIVRRQAAGEVFELELDGYFGPDTTARLGSLLEIGIKATLHGESLQLKNWWSLGKDIDPTEADSY